MPSRQRPATGPTPLYELQLLCPRAAAEATADALQALDALSVSSEDADAGTAAEDAQFGEPGMPAPASAWARTRIRALFSSAAAAAEAAQLIALQDFFARGVVQGITPVQTQDWVELTQSQFEPVCIRPDFWIVPSWHEPPEAARHVIRLDPGLAFGTGTHPTTAMCLRWISGQALTGQRVLDYGCGSGILALAAALYGAAAITAVDTDPAALHATATNAAHNGVVIQTARPDEVRGSYDLVVANILAAPLVALAPALSQLVAAGGHLLLSGLLRAQAPALQHAYARWIDLDLVDSQDGWILLAGENRHAATVAAA